MKYLIDKKLRPCSELKETDLFVEVLSFEEFEENEKENRYFQYAEDSIKRCKVYIYEKMILGTLDIPDLKQIEVKKWQNIFKIDHRSLILIGDVSKIQARLEQLNNMVEIFDRPAQVLFHLIEDHIKDNEDIIQEYFDELDAIEEDLMNKKLENDLESRLLWIRKQVLVSYRFHQQLKEMLKEMADCPYPILNKKDIRLFRYLQNRVDLCYGENEKQKEQIVGLRDMIQLARNEKQDKAIRFLTIATSIFMPLTFLTGWYGMNFSKMPELSWEHGYEIIIVLSVIIFLIELYVFKKKKLL